MKKLISIFIVILISFSSFSQVKLIDNNNDLQIVRSYKNDTLLVIIDTIFTFNQKTFTLYNQAYNAYRNNATCQEFYDPIIARLNQQIQNQNTSYNDLFIKYNDANDEHQKYINKSTKIYDQLKVNNNTLKINNDLLKADLNKLKRQQKWKMIKVGTISFTVGGTIATAVYLILKN